jgi:ParB family chromosome partitioning protein
VILDTPELVELPLDQVHPADDNVRKHVGDVKELAASIRAVGILEPLVVTPNGDGYTIAADADEYAAAAAAYAAEAADAAASVEDREDALLDFLDDMIDQWGKAMAEEGCAADEPPVPVTA